MGLGDWLRGGKKKEQFREAVKEAVSDGKLTEQKRAELESLREELGSDTSDDKTQMRRDVYNVAVGAVKAGGKLTPKEEAELRRIQDFLNLKDDQVDKTRMDLRRLSVVTEINKGKLPVVSRDNASLKGLPLEPGEIAHYAVAATCFETPDAGAVIGERFLFGSAFRAGMGRSFSLPVKGAVSRGGGVFVLSNQRFIFHGANGTIGIKLRQPEDIYFYADGLRLKMKKSQLLYQISAQSVMDVVCAILAKLEPPK
jgi:hypothetical protein